MYTRDNRTWAEINLKNLDHNYREIKKHLPEGTGFIALCKANAYGHGMVEIAERLAKLGADYIAVSCIDEAVEVREVVPTKPVLVLSPTPADRALDIAFLDLSQTIGDIETARAMNKLLVENGRLAKVHIKLDTGMGRTGFNIFMKKTVQDLRELMCMAGLRVEGVYTHFSVSDEIEGEAYTKTQYKNFMSACDILEKQLGRSFGIRHCANSGAVVNYKEMCCDMVRPGILLYGGYRGETGMDLRPVMELKSRIYSINEHKKGDTISYGRTYTCEKDMKIALIPIGYGDGLLRCLSSKMEVLVNGKLAPQIGRICMDVCMIDVSDIEHCKLGDEVVIFGEGVSADELSKKADTISYELFCAVSQRVPRIYLT